jgi:glycosyltransferase involved in cell wall biosynthesis
MLLGLSIALAVFWVTQFLPALAYGRLLWHSRPVQDEPKDLPKFCVGMPLRGADPHLATAIRRIADQDYPNFELRIVVDSKDDPAWDIVERVVRDMNRPNIRVSEIRSHSDSCSAYCNALAQYLDELDDSCKLVGFADADMIVPRDWLRNMAVPLANPIVGATLGNRWYVPVGSKWGTCVRYLWNAGAVVPMWLYQMPWTGALAMRRETVCRAGMANKLRRGMTEDAPVKSSLQQLGLRLQFVPQLMIPNQEETGLPACYQFIQRQLLWTRLYHPHWWTVLASALALTAAMYVPFVVAICFAAMRIWPDAVLAFCAGAGYLAGQAALLLMLELSVRKTFRDRIEPLQSVSWTMWIRTLFAIPLTQLLYVIAMISCVRKRGVLWRGVEYRIDGPWDIHVVHRASDKASLELQGDNVSL